MNQFHKTDKGKVEPCTATVRACRYGAENHYADRHEASRATMRSTLPRSTVATRRPSLASSPSRALQKREQSLLAAAQIGSNTAAKDQRRVALRQEVYFNEHGYESGNGVIVSRLYNGRTSVHLPLTYRNEFGEWEAVQLSVSPGGSVSGAFRSFLDGVEHVPPGTYRIVGTTSTGEQVITSLSTEHYARLRAALRAAEPILRAPVPSTLPPNNSNLLKVLTNKDNSIGGTP